MQFPSTPAATADNLFLHTRCVPPTSVSVWQGVRKQILPPGAQRRRKRERGGGRRTSNRLQLCYSWSSSIEQPYITQRLKHSTRVTLLEDIKKTTSRLFIYVFITYLIFNRKQGSEAPFWMHLERLPLQQTDENWRRKRQIESEPPESDGIIDFNNLLKLHLIQRWFSSARHLSILPIFLKFSYSSRLEQWLVIYIWRRNNGACTIKRAS